MNILCSFRKTFILLILLLNVGWTIPIHAQNGWELMKPMKIPKGGSQSCVIDNMIYVIGGCDSSMATLNSAEVYNTVTDEWSDLAPVPIDIYESNAEAIKDVIYIVGGWRSIGYTWITIDSTFEYNPDKDSWKIKKEFPVNTGTNSSCVINDKLYILGGLKNFANRDTSGQKQALVYDPACDTWDSIPKMLYERGEGSTACVFDNKIYVFGGLHAIPEIPHLFIIGKSEMYDPISNIWTELADMPVAVVNHISLVHNNKLYVFGGDSGTFTASKSYGTNIIQEYDPATNKWSLMQGMPFNRGNMTGQKVGNFVYLISIGVSSTKLCFEKMITFVM